MRFLPLFGVRGQSLGGCSKPVQQKMKNFAQTKLNGKNGGYPWQRSTVVDPEMSMSPVLVSRARFRKGGGL